jgi:alginate O-acetyltransferase complex protein AlgI
MVFSSHLFVFYFLPLALLVYYCLPQRARHLGLTLLSYVFYGWSNPYFVPLMMASTLIDYACGLALVRGQAGPDGRLVALAAGSARTRAQKTALCISITTNLGLLAFFKYFNFGIESYNALLQSMGASDLQWEHFLRITLPLGISFYTFQSMSYTIDVYRGNAGVIRNGVDFACYVSMFPQLVAGPIVRFHEVADQLRSRSHTLTKFARGVAFFSLGMAKKILLANPCGKVADICFDAGSLQLLDAWYGACAYAFQIYFDFSGYSDMAIGLGLMLGFVFPRNFDRPYVSQSITELWQRWHISLSSWLRDYLYIPLGGNRSGAARTYVNLALVMLLGGLWHGAAWTFLAWGAYHGVLLMAERRLGRERLYRQFPALLKVVFTFVALLFSWVLFRADDLPHALRYAGDMLGLGEAQGGAALIAGIIYRPYYLLSIALAAYVVWGCRDTWEYTRELALPKAAYCLALLLLALVAMTAQAYNPFIYFIF